MGWHPPCPGTGWDNAREKEADDAELEREWEPERLSPWDERFTGRYGDDE